MPQQLRAALLNRVSTDDQDPTGPLPELRAYARRIHAKVAMERTEIRTGRSDGPALLDVLSAARAGEINLVVVWRVDRIGRRASNILRAIEQLHTDGCRVDVVADRLVLKPGADAVTTYVMQGMATFAQLEHARIVERTREGLERARRRGARLGRPTAELLDAGAVNRLAAAGMGGPAIAAQLETTRWRVRQALASCINCGRSDVRWRPCPRCSHPRCSCGHHRGATTPLDDEECLDG